MVGVSGSLTLRFSKFIRRMQEHEKQKGRPLFFLVENVKLTGNDLDLVSKELNTSPISLPSSCFSPCSRDRMYWVNFLVNRHSYADKSSAKISAQLCLQDGFQPARDIARPETVCTKAFTFMASLSRLDDIRMTVYRREPGSNNYEERFMTANERGNMMGFPDNYVTTPLNHIFRHYREGIVSDQWWTNVPDEYHCLSEVLMRVNSRWDSQNGIIEKVELVPRVYSENVDVSQLPYFGEEEYAKRLVGNAWNIPTIVYLLEPLTQIFQRQEYERFGYTYKWETEPAQEE